MERVIVREQLEQVDSRIAFVEQMLEKVRIEIVDLEVRRKDATNARAIVADLEVLLAFYVSDRDELRRELKKQNPE